GGGIRSRPAAASIRKRSESLASRRRLPKPRDRAVPEKRPPETLGRRDARQLAVERRSAEAVRRPVGEAVEGEDVVWQQFPVEAHVEEEVHQAADNVPPEDAPVCPPRDRDQEGEQLV